MVEDAAPYARIVQAVLLNHIVLPTNYSVKKAREFAVLYRKGVNFPPVELTRYSDGTFTVKGGRHRVMGANFAARVTILARYSTRANLAHDHYCGEHGEMYRCNCLRPLLTVAICETCRAQTAEGT